MSARLDAAAIARVRQEFNGLRLHEAICGLCRNGNVLWRKGALCSKNCSLRHNMPLRPQAPTRQTGERKR